MSSARAARVRPPRPGSAAECDGADGRAAEHLHGPAASVRGTRPTPSRRRQRRGGAALQGAGRHRVGGAGERRRASPAPRWDAISSCCAGQRPAEVAGGARGVALWGAAGGKCPRGGRESSSSSSSSVSPAAFPPSRGCHPRPGGVPGCSGGARPCGRLAMLLGEALRLLGPSGGRVPAPRSPQPALHMLSGLLCATAPVALGAESRGATP